MRQDVGGDEAELWEPPACQGRKHELALQAQELLAHQRHFFHRPAVKIQLEDGVSSRAILYQRESPNLYQP